MIHKSIWSRGAHALITATILLTAASASHAGLTDIFTKPVTPGDQQNAKPNIMLLMDTSSSMSFSHMPDQIEGDFIATPIGYKSSQCNSIYYNPNTTYGLPKAADGTFLPDVVWPTARYNYYSTVTTTVNLSTNFQAYDLSSRNNQTPGAYDTAQPAYYYVYTGSEPLTYNSLPCTQVDVGATVATAGGGTWTRKIVSSTSGIFPHVDERVNFARWYVYYRTRMAMAKSSVGLAFSPITSSFRVGFISTTPGTPVASSSYLAISDFNTTNKAAWYDKVYAQVPSGSSPMREALARVGRHYGNKHDGINQGMPEDPVQYSCQNNYTIMTTDGYWNTSAETAGPVKLDGTSFVANQDGSFTGESGNTPYGVWDGGSTTTRVTSNSVNSYAYISCPSSYVSKTTTQTTQDTTWLGKTTTQQQKHTDQALETKRQYLKTTTNNTRTVYTVKKQQQQTSQVIFQNRQTNTNNQQSTSQSLKKTFQVQKTDTQNYQIENYFTQTVTNSYQKTYQITKITRPITAVTQNQVKTDTTLYKSTVQYRKTTSSIQQTLSRPLTKTTTQKVQRYKYTVQYFRYNGATELSTPFVNCVQTGTYTCYNVPTAQVLVDSCVAVAASTDPTTGNNATQTVCPADVPVQSCSGTGCITNTVGPDKVACTASAASAPNWITTTCTPAVAGDTTNVLVCNTQTAAQTNGWTTITCPTPASPVTVGIPANNCVAGNSGSPNFITTSCPGTLTTTDVAVATCTGGTDANYETTTCNTKAPTVVVTKNVACSNGNTATVATVCSLDAAVTTSVTSCAANSNPNVSPYKVISCPTNATTTETGVQCSAGTVGTNVITCGTTTQVQTAVKNCVPVTAGAPNWQQTDCTVTGPTTTGLAAACTSSDAAVGNVWVTKVCSAANTTQVPIATVCAQITGTSINGGHSVTCPTPTVTVTTHTTGAIGWPCVNGTTGTVVTTCGTTTPVFVPFDLAACNAITPKTPDASNHYTTTQCLPSAPVTAPYPSACGAVGTVITAPNAGNNFTTTTCAAQVVTTVGIQNACVANPSPTSSPWTYVSCPGAINTSTPIAAASCVTQSPLLSNQWVTKSCPFTINTLSPAPIDPATCNAGTDAFFTVTSCPQTFTETNKPFNGICASINPSSPNWVTTICNLGTPVTTPISTPCVPVTAPTDTNFTFVSCPALTPANNYVDKPVVSCATTPATASPWIDTSCRHIISDTNVPAGSCNLINASSTTVPPYTATTCPTNNTAETAIDPTSTCVNGTDANYMTTTCTPHSTLGVPVQAGGATCVNQTAASPTWITKVCNTIGPTTTTVDAANCAAADPVDGNSFTRTTCTPLTGEKMQMTNTSSTVTQELSGTAVTSTIAPPAVVTISYPDNGGACYTLGVPPVKPPLLTAQPALPGSCTAWPCVVDTPHSIGGSGNALADVAQYYYITDLRPELADNPGSIKGITDNAPWQHMTTYGLGLGVSGTLAFDPNYWNPANTNGDFPKIRPAPTTPVTLPTMNWPAWPDLGLNYASDLRLYNNAKSIDDFWHAAVNGRGRYFSAGDPSAVVGALSSTFLDITSHNGAGNGAAVSNAEPVINDNYIYLANYKSIDWYGDVARSTIVNKAISSTYDWSTQVGLDGATFAACDNRKIYIRRAGAASNLANFSWNSLNCTTNATDTSLNSTEQAYFNSSVVTGLSQYTAMSDGSNGTIDQRSNAAGFNLVNFIRGQRGLEVADNNVAFVANASKLYRKRVHVLGDIAGSLMAFVKPPNAEYSDAGYSSFKSSKSGRTPMIYVGANDGMLHAIYSPTVATDPNYAKAGQEAWAYVPQAVMPELFHLADTQYSTNHRFYVDGSPIYGDIYDSTAAVWKTILVGGLNAGGKGYYALDVTDPDSPKSLWEFNFSSTCYDSSLTTTWGADCHLGLTFGRPIITKLVNGTWVVLVTSGYNNVRSTPGTNDGHGFLYVLNAVTGKIISKIDTGAGDATTPSGLREINNYVANAGLDNTTLRVYGGDLLGNVWRFDINNTIAPTGFDAALITTAKDALGNGQPITTRVQLAEVDGQTMVVAASGKFLGSTDLSSTQVQSVYGFKDSLAATVQYPDIRATSRILTLAGTSTVRSAACSVTANCTFTAGWIVDLPESGERVNIDPFIVAGTVVFVSNVPSSTSSCDALGHSWLNYVDLLNGGNVASAANGEASVRLADRLMVGLSYIVNPDGTVTSISRPIDDSPPILNAIPTEPPAPIGRRVSWREIKK